MSPHTKPSIRTNSRRHGFTVIELFVVISILCGVASLLLPAIMSSRDPLNRKYATDVLERACLELERYHEDKGKYPLDLAAAHGEGYFQNHVDRLAEGEFVLHGVGLLEIEWVTDPDQVLGHVAFLRAHGPEGEQLADRILEDGPPLPQPLIVGNPLWIRDDGRQEMMYMYDCEIVTIVLSTVKIDALRNLRVLALFSNAELLLASQQPDDAARQVFSVLEDPDTLAFTFSLFDANGDGQMTVAEFSRKCRQLAEVEVDEDSDLITVVTQRFFEVLVDEVHLSPIDDRFDSEEHSITVEDITGDPREIYSWDGLADLTISAGTHEGLENALLVKLWAAAEAESEGDFDARDAFLSDYQNLLRAQSGKKLTVEQSEVLDISAEVRRGQ